MEKVSKWHTKPNMKSQISYHFHWRLISKKDQTLFNFSLKPFFLTLKGLTLFNLTVADKLV